MKHLIATEDAVLGFYIGEHQIDCLSANKLQRFEKASGQLLLEKKIFEKNGLARILTADDQQLFVSDFCTLYAFRQENYEPLGKWQLGVDLSSDICGMTMDENTVYCSIRNGSIVTVDRNSFERTTHSISDSSMWSLKTYQDHLLCGTVAGQLLLLNKSSLAVEKSLTLSRQNIRRLLLDVDNDSRGSILYAAAQDKKLFQIDLAHFEILGIQKNIHPKMFDCAGIYQDLLVTVSHPGSEISFWNKHTLEKVKTLSVPLKLSGNTCLTGSQLYLSSRNICGIDLIDLNDC